MHRSTLLDPKLLSSASELLADAFHSNPAHVYVCPDETTRRRQLAWLLGGNLRAQPSLDDSFCLCEGSSVVAMGFWTHSESPAPGLYRQLRAGLLLAPLRLGWSGARRMYEVSESIRGHLDAARLAEPYWYLNNMVVHEKLRGRGIGSDLLGRELKKITALDPQSSIALSTQREENVVFYGRLGFEVRYSGIIGTGARSFRSWVMARGPAE